ncbi:50S ribosomal protein L13 [Patescibacteria group bacterium]|nr:50S ribosomal protein L13 [Patescibacteria group bacterium]
MKTHTPKAEEIERNWYLIDAKDKVLGKIATVVADKLRGKDRPTFTPHMDCGDYIIIINADKIQMTGGKMNKKMYARHSGYPSGYREETAAKLMERKPTKVLELAISGMLPKNKLRSVFMKKLHLYAGEEHPHTAQTPKPLEV